MKNSVFQQKIFICMLISNCFATPQILSAGSKIYQNENANLQKNNKSLHKRQVSIDDLLNTALQLVQPIFDTSQPLTLDNTIIPKRIIAEQSTSVRETKILGAPEYSSLREVPICRGNSQICKFISCTARNFKYDQNFSNLNLAAQLIGDEEFRKTISRNPETITTVCHEQGLSTDQCKIFSRGFQLIDRVMTSIQKPKIIKTNTDDDQPENIKTDINNSNFLHPLNYSQGPINDAPETNRFLDMNSSKVYNILPETTKLTPIRPVNYPMTKPAFVSFDYLNRTAGNVGSRTWSTHSKVVNPRPPRNDENKKIQSKQHRTATTIESKKLKSIINTSLRVVNYGKLVKKNKSQSKSEPKNFLSTLTKSKEVAHRETIPRASKPHDTALSGRPISLQRKIGRDFDDESYFLELLERPERQQILTSNKPEIDFSLLYDSTESSKTKFDDDVDVDVDVDALTETVTERPKSTSSIPEAEEYYTEDEEEEDKEEKLKKNHNKLKSKNQNMFDQKHFGNRRKRSDDYYDTVDSTKNFLKLNASSPTYSNTLNKAIRIEKKIIGATAIPTRLDCFQYLG